MKLTMLKTTVFLLSFTVTLSSLPHAVAQPDPGTRPGRRGPLPEEQRGERPRGPAMAGSRFVPGLERVMVVLTPEQRDSIREAMGEQRDKVRNLEEKIREARKELLEIGLRDNFSESAIRKQATAVAKLEAERTVLLAKALSRVHPRLSEEQIERIKNPSPADFAPGRRPGPANRQDFRRDENNLPPREDDRFRPPPGPR